MVGHALIEQRRLRQRLEAVARHQFAHFPVDGGLVGFEQRQHFGSHRFFDLPSEFADLHQHVRVVAIGNATDAVQNQEQLVTTHAQFAAHANVPAQPSLKIRVGQNIGRVDVFEQPQMLARIGNHTAHGFDHRNVQVPQETLGSRLGNGVFRHRTCLVSIQPS